MNKRTPEQQARADILLELEKAVGVGGKYTQLTPPNTTWLHFTDWNNFIDLPKLEAMGLLRMSDYLFYEPAGDWQDDFPPTAYHLNPKAVLILRHPANWVFDGDFTPKQKDAYKAELKKRLDDMPGYSMKLAKPEEDFTDWLMKPYKPLLDNRDEV